MDKQPVTVTFKFDAVEPTLADLKKKILALLDSDEAAKKFAAEFPKDATARGGFQVQTFTLGVTGTGGETAGKGGGNVGGSFSMTFGRKG